MKLLATAFVLGLLGSSGVYSLINDVSSTTTICTKGTDQVIYNDVLGYTVADWSWGEKARNYTNVKPVHSGTRSISWIPKSYEAIYFNLQSPIDPSVNSAVSFWVHGNKFGNQRVLVRFTLNKVAVSHDFFLWGPESVIIPDPSQPIGPLSGNIQAGKWVNAVINLDNLEPGQYDGIQILTAGPEEQEMLFIDDIEVYKRCMSTNPYRNLMKPLACDGHDCVTVAVKEGGKKWIANGVEYQEYSVTIKNTNTAAVTILEFNGGWFKPRDTKDIWNVSYLEGGYFGLPDNVPAIYPGQEYTFGCVSVKGPVSFKISYVEYENEKSHPTVIKPTATKPPTKPPTKPTTGASTSTTGSTSTTTKPTAKPTAKPSTKPPAKTVSPASKTH